MKNRGRLFLSHSSHDKPFADTIVRWLKAYGFEDIWYDNQSLGEGKLRENIGAALASADIFVVLLTPDALRSDWVNGEVDDALALRREGAPLKIIPILLKRCRIPFMLNSYKCLDMTPGKDLVAEMALLVRMIEGHELSEASPDPPGQAVSPPLFQEAPKREGSKFSINFNGDVRANRIQSYQGENISITEQNGSKPLPGFIEKKDSWEQHDAEE